jgi:PAS domain S-box-containing protein
MNAEATRLLEKESKVQSARILVVEDERIVARGLGKQLTALGYEVVGSVPSGEEAVQQAGELEVDLVLMDINLEGPMDGVAAAAIVRKQFRLPVVYLTAYSNMEILERAKVTEPFGYILKPYEDRELHVVIETALYKHRMERRNQDREQWFVATLKSIRDAVVATDDEDCITYMNPPAEGLTGWTIADARGRTLNDVVRLVRVDSHQPVDLRRDGARHAGARSEAILLITKDLSERAVEERVSLIHDEQGAALGSVVVFRDVTERNLLEQQTRQAKKMEAVAQLAGGVAHALNNLMTSVLGYSEIMLDAMKPDSPYFAGAQEIKRSATRTAALTQKLLAFGRKQILKLRPVDINAIVGRQATALRLVLGSIRLDLNLEPGLGVTNADPDQLEDAIFTLIRNANDAMPDGGRVTIETAHVDLGQDFVREYPEIQPGPFVLLAVSDTGVGMGPDAISHLFEPFYTADTGVGSGLGLAAVYGLVKQCGGAIDVQSTPESGTTFRIFLPREGAG